MNYGPKSQRHWKEVKSREEEEEEFQTIYFIDHNEQGSYPWLPSLCLPFQTCGQTEMRKWGRLAKISNNWGRHPGLVAEICWWLLVIELLACHDRHAWQQQFSVGDPIKLVGRLTATVDSSCSQYHHPQQLFEYPFMTLVKSQSGINEDFFFIEFYCNLNISWLSTLFSPRFLH